MLDLSDDLFAPEEDKLHDECGVVGVYLNAKKADGSETTADDKKYVAYSATDFSAATQVYYGLYALQHRGQDSAGIAVSDGSEIKMHKGMAVSYGQYVLTGRWLRAHLVDVSCFSKIFTIYIPIKCCIRITVCRLHYH